jgi:hypothetical protein
MLNWIASWGKFIAEIGLDEMERRLGYYIGIANQQS